MTIVGVDYHPSEGPSFPVPRAVLVPAGLGCSELAWCPVIERCVRTALIIFPPPGLDELSCLFQIQEPVRAKALAAEGTVEEKDLSPPRRTCGYKSDFARRWTAL